MKLRSLKLSFDRIVLIITVCLSANTLSLNLDSDLLIFNADIYTSNNKNPKADSLVVSDGYIVYVGNYFDAQHYVGKSTKLIDLDGKTVLPGFIDSHTHLSMGARLVKGIDLYNMNSISDWQNTILENIPKFKDSQWLFGARWDHTLTSNGELPTVSDLDELKINKPIALRDIDGHSMWINTKAYKRLVNEYPVEKLQSEGVIYNEDGTFSGILKERAMELVDELDDYQNSLAVSNKDIQRTLSFTNSLGITGMHDMPDEHTLRDLKQLAKENKLYSRILFGSIIDCRESDCIEEHLRRGSLYKHSNRNEFLLSPYFIKLFIDGVLSTHTAAMQEEYSDKDNHFGELLYLPSEIGEIVKRSNDAGIPVAVHAIGDAAVKVTLDVFEKYGSREVTNRIEHAEIIDERDLVRFKKLNVALSMHPNHGTGVIGKYISERIGAKREKNAYVWNSAIKEDAQLMLGSDWPTAPLSPMIQIADAIFRVGPFETNDRPWYPNQKLSFYDALVAYTLTPAKVSGVDKYIGSLEKGKYADFVILNKKLNTFDRKEFLATNVMSTYFFGKEIYSANN